MSSPERLFQIRELIREAFAIGDQNALAIALHSLHIEFPGVSSEKDASTHFSGVRASAARFVPETENAHPSEQRQSEHSQYDESEQKTYSSYTTACP
jgi:hypothetical protein